MRAALAVDAEAQRQRRALVAELNKIAADCMSLGWDIDRGLIDAGSLEARGRAIAKRLGVLAGQMGEIQP